MCRRRDIMGKFTIECQLLRDFIKWRANGDDNIAITMRKDGIYCGGMSLDKCVMYGGYVSSNLLEDYEYDYEDEKHVLLDKTIEPKLAKISKTEKIIMDFNEGKLHFNTVGKPKYKGDANEMCDDDESELRTWDFVEEKIPFNVEVLLNADDMMSKTKFVQNDMVGSIYFQTIDDKLVFSGKGDLSSNAVEIDKEEINVEVWENNEKTGLAPSLLFENLKMYGKEDIILRFGNNLPVIMASKTENTMFWCVIAPRVES